MQKPLTFESLTEAISTGFSVGPSSLRFESIRYFVCVYTEQQARVAMRSHPESRVAILHFLQEFLDQMEKDWYVLFGQFIQEQEVNTHENVDKKEISGKKEAAGAKKFSKKKVRAKPAKPKGDA